MNAEYRSALREFISRRGHPVRIDPEMRERHPDSPDLWVSTFGWHNYEAIQHVQECGAWIVPEGVTLTEVTYSEFTDTYSDNDQTVGINVESTEVADIHCTCGRYTSVTLRWDGTLTEALSEIFGMPTTPPKTVL